jgi:hypothetical protein
MLHHLSGLLDRVFYAQVTGTKPVQVHATDPALPLEPWDRALVAHITDMFDVLIATMIDTKLEPDLEDLCRSLASLFYRAEFRIQREIDDNEDAQKRMAYRVQAISGGSSLPGRNGCPSLGFMITRRVCTRPRLAVFSRQTPSAMATGSTGTTMCVPIPSTPPTRAGYFTIIRDTRRLPPRRSSCTNTSTTLCT